MVFLRRKVARDGKQLLYARGSELWILIFPELKSRLFLKSPSIVMGAQFSPNGKWVAYASNETSRWEIYVTAFLPVVGRERNESKESNSPGCLPLD